MLALLKHEVNTQDFIFQAIQRWLVINLDPLIYGYSYLISLDDETVVSYWMLRSFQGTQVNLNGLLEKHRYHVFIVELLKRNLMSQVTEWFRRPRTMLKILYVSGNQEFFQKPPEIKLFYGRGRKHPYLLGGEALSVKLSTGEATGAHLTGALGQGVLKTFFRCQSI